MNDGKCRYRGILLPSAVQTKRDASQVASIHLSGKGARPFQEKFASFSVMAAKQSNSLN